MGLRGVIGTKQVDGAIKKKGEKNGNYKNNLIPKAV